MENQNQDNIIYEIYNLISMRDVYKVLTISALMTIVLLLFSQQMQPYRYYTLLGSKGRSKHVNPFHGEFPLSDQSSDLSAMAPKSDSDMMKTKEEDKVIPRDSEDEQQIQATTNAEDSDVVTTTSGDFVTCQFKLNNTGEKQENTSQAPIEQLQNVQAPLDTQAHTFENTTHDSLENSRNTSNSLRYNNDTEDKDWATTMAERFDKRKKWLGSQCANFKGILPKPLTLTFSDGLYYQDKYKLLVCIAAEGGVSESKLHFANMSSYAQNTSSAESDIAYAKWLQNAGFAKASRNYNDNTIPVILVRHPLQRLYLAYKDKFDNGTRISWNSSEALYVKMVLKSEGIEPSLSSFYKPVTFLRFLQMVVAEKNPNLEVMDHHWRPYSTMCEPCTITYDYVIKVETIEDDLRYLKKRLGIKEIDISKINSVSKLQDGLYADYYKHIPPELMKKIYDIYRYDIQLFMYDISRPLK